MNKIDIIETKSGKVQGYRINGLQIFKGIPYAASPIGDLRFNPPAPKEPWSDVLDATEYGPFVPQGGTDLWDFFGKIGRKSEVNCLTLNVWTPATDGA